ncbi:MAG: hypothetical protein P3M72_00045 [Candidatus Hodgkinia cicadicola]|nr:MAG: hypothetical protein P3M72_00045 [Candidatus Hodgkinia cicadicola]
MLALNEEVNVANVASICFNKIRHDPKPSLKTVRALTEATKLVSLLVNTKCVALKANSLTPPNPASIDDSLRTLQLCPKPKELNLQTLPKQSGCKHQALNKSLRSPKPRAWLVSQTNETPEAVLKESLLKIKALVRTFNKNKHTLNSSIATLTRFQREATSFDRCASHKIFFTNLSEAELKTKRKRSSNTLSNTDLKLKRSTTPMAWSVCLVNAMLSQQALVFI